MANQIKGFESYYGHVCTLFKAFLLFVLQATVTHCASLEGSGNFVSCIGAKILAQKQI